MQFTIMIKGFTLLTTSSIVYSPRLCSRISTYKYFCHVLPATLPADVSLQHRSIEGYAMETLKYKGEINDRAVQLEGAVRMAQVKERYPEVTLEPVVRDNSAQSASRAAAGVPTGLDCIPVPGQSWNRAWYTDIMNGVDYLHAINRPIPVCAHCCGRISYSYNSGIYVCNDNDYPINVDSNHFADMAEQVANQCYVIIPRSSPMTGGQIFDSDGYNIIVHDNLC